MQKSNTAQLSPAGAVKAGPKTIEVSFSLEDIEATAVHLSGDFNDWSPGGLPMIQRNGHGQWLKRVALRPGRYEYKFVVDGRWIHDPRARANVRNHHGTLNSVVEVGS